jgi:hypothetical protein
MISRLIDSPAGSNTLRMNRENRQRIGSESEPPNLPTEKNAGFCAFDAPNPPSPVRIHEG